MKTFFAAGGAVPWWINGLSLFMSFFSAGTFVVWGSIAYSQGAVSLSIQWMMCLGGLLVGTFIAARWQKTDSLTVAEYLTKRLGYKTQRIYTWLFLFISVFTTGAFLYPVAKIVEVSTGIDISLSIIILGLLITIYTATGGLWAVIVTDVLQFVVLSAAVMIVVPLSFKAAGGFSNFLHTAPEGFFSLTNNEYTGSFLIAFGLYNLVFIGGNWAYVQRYTSVSAPREAKKVGWLFGALYTVSPIIWMLPPMLYRIIQPELNGLADEGAYLMICKQVMPAGLLGLVLGGMVFATASSVNTTLNISAGVLTNDLYKHFVPNASDKKLMRFARFATGFFGIFTIMVALLVPKMGGIVEVVLSVAAITGGAMYLPPVWSLFSKRQTALSIISATVISLLINSYFKFLAPTQLGITLSRELEMELGVGLPVVILLLWEIWFLFKKGAASSDYNKEQTIEANTTSQQLEEETEEQNTNNREGVKKIGMGMLAIGVLMLVLGIYAFEPYAIVTGIILSGLSSWIIFKQKA
ncbi:sodium transporter (plasmid) [Chondrinema litorale]|nr:sodium transporter [Chondrinema litorale]UZR99168.1 sodium transporter [Chondrinema litorale]